MYFFEKKNIIKNIEENDNVSDAITKISNIENIFNIKTRDFVIKLIKEKQEIRVILRVLNLILNLRLGCFL